MVCAEKHGEICLHLSLSHAVAELAMLFSVLFESRHLGGSPLSSSSWGWDVVWHSSGRGWGVVVVGRSLRKQRFPELAMSSAAFLSGGNPANWQCRHSFVHSANADLEPRLCSAPLWALRGTDEQYRLACVWCSLPHWAVGCAVLDYWSFLFRG